MSSSAPSPSGLAQRKRQWTQRSRAGCLTCRARRKRCDMAKPQCDNCSKACKVCEWPVPQRHSLQRIASAPAGRGSMTSQDAAQEDLGMVGGDMMAMFSTANLTPGVAHPSSSIDPLMAGPSTYASSIPAAPVEPLGPTLAPALGTTTSPATWNHDSGYDVDALMSLINETGLQSLSQDWEQSDTAAFLASLSCDPTSFTPGSLPLNPSNDPAAMSLNTYLSDNDQSDLFNHYTHSLSRLLSCTDPGMPSGFEQVVTEMRGPSTSACALHFSILAVAARHLVNQGKLRYENVAERLSKSAKTMLETSPVSLDMSPVSSEDGDREQLASLAAHLTLVRYKILRGDTREYDDLIKPVRALGTSLFRTTPPTGSVRYHIFENLVYHDMLAASFVDREPVVSGEVLQATAEQAFETVSTVTGISFPIFSRLYAMLGMVRERRARLKKGIVRLGVWADERLFDVIQDAQKWEHEVNMEKNRLQTAVDARPGLASHQYLHEALRIASLLHLRSSVYCEAPQSLLVRLLVRQSLSIMEAMMRTQRPGICSLHYAVFITGISAAAGPAEEKDGSGDRARVNKLYDELIEHFSSLNVARSQQIVHAVWDRNAEGSVYVNWLDIVQEREWELYLV